MALFRTLDPATGRLACEFDLHDPAVVEKALTEAERARSAWRLASWGERQALILGVAAQLEERAAELARLMALEMGKPIRQGVAEIEKSARACRHVAAVGREQLESRSSCAGPERFTIRNEPLGVIVIVMPWNFPFWQALRVAVPAIFAGNVILQKHASNTPQCALEIERIFTRAGAPRGVFRNLFVEDAGVRSLIADARIAGASLTGSTAAGRAVGESAGRAIKPAVLELGGSDPFLVFEDADVDAAVWAAIVSRCQNSGQSCVAAKRFLVHDSVASAFEEGLVSGMESQVMAHPTDSRTDIGPLARADLRETLSGQVAACVARGDRLLLGGAPAPGEGFYFPPSVIDGRGEPLPVGDAELFGPVAFLSRFGSAEQALRMANATAYGLGASVWTADDARAAAFCRDLEAGMVFVNGIVSSDPAVPFGGVKASGVGRELGPEGLRSFVNVKTIWTA